MRLTRLQLSDFRCFTAIEWAPGPGLNLLVGPNGAGKTSLLEAAHLLAYGRSFRGRVADGLIRDGSAALSVYAEWVETGLRNRRAGLRHDGQRWEGRLDGEAAQTLGDLCAALAVVTFEPDSHDLVSGGAECRRRFVDWGLFHVEHGFLDLWRRYSRALKQRNALLKGRSRDAQLDAWERELAEAGEPLTQARQRYLDMLQPRLQAIAGVIAPSLVMAALELQPGWRSDLMPLADALVLARERDLASGFTSVGPHRADWRVLFASLPGRKALSRGQGKLTALSLLLAQAELHAGLRRDWPVVALDDLGSELDAEHRERVLTWLTTSGAQVLITANDPPVSAEILSKAVVFHVEQGAVQPAN